MLKVVALMILLWASPASAIEFEVQGRGGEVLGKSSPVVQLPATIASLTRPELDALSLASDADENGVTEIAGLGTAIDIDPVDGNGRYYGWCFSINGVTPANLMAYEAFAHEQTDRVVWFYAYAKQFPDGTWSMCEPAPAQPKP